jgi:predicted phosphodiesterase
MEFRVPTKVKPVVAAPVPFADEVLHPLVHLEESALVAELSRRGWIAHKDDPTDARHIVLDAPKRGKVKIAFESDTHIGSKYQQVTRWHEFAKAAGEWGADYVLHAGDAYDGIHKMHRGMEYEQFIHGFRAHLDYGVNNWPVFERTVKARPGGRARTEIIPQSVIGGNHDGSYYNEAGADILGATAARRPDITVLGAPAATFHISGLSIYLVHPDGGVPYARSYKPQKAVEQLAPENKPHLWVAGHWHTPVHVPGYRNVEAFTLPSFQAQSSYLMRKGLMSTVGGVLMELEFSEHGLEDLTVKWVIYRRHIERDYPTGRG